MGPGWAQKSDNLKIRTLAQSAGSECIPAVAGHHTAIYICRKVMNYLISYDCFAPTARICVNYCCPKNNKTCKLSNKHCIGMRHAQVLASKHAGQRRTQTTSEQARNKARHKQEANADLLGEEPGKRQQAAGKDRPLRASLLLSLSSFGTIVLR